MTTLALLYLLILIMRKGNRLVDTFKLTEGLEADQLELGKWDQQTMVEACAFIVGGILFAETLPLLIQNVLISAYSSASQIPYEGPSAVWEYSIIKGLVGLVIAWQRKRIAACSM